MNITVINLLKLMAERNVSSVQLTKDIPLNNSALTEWKKDKASPSQKTLEKIANYFSVPISYFYQNNLSEFNYEKPFKTPIKTNTVTVIARGGERHQYELSDEEIKAFQTLLEKKK